MPLAAFADQLPDFARDLRSNLDALLGDSGLSDQQKYGLFLACAHGTGHKPLVAAAESEAEGKISAEAAEAARAAAAVMAMNNVYYRFVHLASNPVYSTMKAQLKMSVIADPGIDKCDFELFCVAVSVINGCGKCIDAHERVLSQHCVTADAIQTAARIGAVMKAIATVHATL